MADDEQPASDWTTRWDDADADLAEAFVEFDTHDARDALESVGFVVQSEPAPLKSNENRVFRVETDEGRAAMKVFRHGRSTREALEEQARFVARLDAAGVPVNVALPLPGGGFVAEHEGQAFSLFSWTDDLDVPRDERSADWFAIGSAIATMHEVGAAMGLRHQPEYTPSTWGRGNLEYLRRTGVVHAAVREEFFAAATELLADADERWPAMPLIPVHGDLGYWNIAFASPRATFMDFEDLGSGLALQDVGLVAHGLVNNGLCGAETAARIDDAVRSGYASVRPDDIGDRRLFGMIEAMRGIFIDAWIAARRYDRHFSLRRLEFHTQRYWRSRVERIARYRAW
ncbi:MAG: phosphotransferase [Actinomycetota bacterium]